MNDKQIAEKIRRDLRKKWPYAVYQVSYVSGNLSLEHVGGSKYKDQYPNKGQAVDELIEVIRQTIPDFSMTSYE